MVKTLLILVSSSDSSSLRLNQACSPKSVKIYNCYEDIGSNPILPSTFILPIKIRREGYTKPYPTTFYGQIVKKV